MNHVPQTTSCRCRFAALAILMVMIGCSPKPELHLADQGEHTVTSAQGKHLLEQGRAVDAVAAFRKHLRLEGPDLQSLNGLAIAYGELGRADLAAEMFSRALAMTPDDPATLNNIGFAALRRADVRLARHYLERARDRSGELHEIDGNLKRLALLEAFEGKPRTRSALDPANRLPPDGHSTSVHLLTLPDVDHGSASGTPTPKPPSETPPAAMIDFTAVVDPFAQESQRRHVQ